MNQDEHKPDLQTYIEPELEARVVAAVLGEASAFEAAELDRLVSERPEMGVFRRRIEAVHGLVGQAVRREVAPLRLAPERRAKILQTIGAPATKSAEPGPTPAVLLELAAARRKRRLQWIRSYGLAACITLVAMGLMTMHSSNNQRLAKSRQEEREAQARESAVHVMEMPRLVAEEPSEDDAGMLAYSSAPPQAMERASNEPVHFGVVGGVKIPANRPVGLGKGVSAFAPPRPALRDLGSALSLATPDFLKDTGASSTTGTRGARSASQARAASADSAAPADAGKEWAAAAPELSFSDKPVVLSPFEVKGESMGGYAASSTLAGARVRPNLRSSGAAIGTKPAISDFAKEVNRVARQKAAKAVTFDRNDGFLSGGAKAVAAAAPVEATAGTDASAAAVDTALSERALPARPTPGVDAPQAEVSTAQEPVSTFSLHVSDVSFQLAQAALARGEMPDPQRIRPEEFYNAFDYGDPTPANADKIACRIEQAAHPMLQQRNLVRIAMKVPAAGRGAGQPLNLTVLLDTSGSMERTDRATSVRAALGVLASLLTPDDRVTLIGFARQPRLLAEHLAGDQAKRLVDLASTTPFTGGTNLEAALGLAGELARRHHNASAQNRIVLITDGAANLGNADPAQLAMRIETLRQQGVAFDACGVGTDGLDDAVLEALTRKGDGRYYVLDAPENADAGFARQLAGAFRPAAENIKVQVRFNPARVASYRLIGFEQHRLREQDFRNDQVDAAELAAEESAVALYQVEVLPQGEGELGDVFARFRDPATGSMVERSWTMLHEPHAPAFEHASPSLQLAGVAALVAEKLRGDDAAGQIHLGELAGVVNRLRGHYGQNLRVQQLLAMFEQLRRRAGE